MLYSCKLCSLFRQAMKTNSKTMISTPYIDGFGMGYLVTISRSVNYKNNGELAGVLGTDYFVSQFGETLLQGEMHKSVIVDSIGAVIYHKKFSQDTHRYWINGRFRNLDGSVSDLEPLTLTELEYNNDHLASYLESNSVTVMKCHDVVKMQTRKALDLDNFMDGKESVTVGDIVITHLAGTNAYILKSNAGPINLQSCLCKN